MEQTGVVRRYAIGGAVGAIFYMEPMLTYDLDVFVQLPESGGRLVTLASIYDYLRARGYQEERECVVIEGVPVQFLPVFNPLTEEALAEAQSIRFERTPTRVLRAEHLVAIMLQMGRPKDRERLASFVVEAALNEQYLDGVLERHGLTAAWRQWRDRT